MVCFLAHDLLISFQMPAFVKLLSRKLMFQSRRLNFLNSSLDKSELRDGGGRGGIVQSRYYQFHFDNMGLNCGIKMHSVNK